MMMMPLRPSKPSISASSWLSVCSRSSCDAHRRLDADLAERVELVDEHDARRLGFGLREEVAHARRADADEHLDELRAAQAEEGDFRFAATARASSVLPVPGGPTSRTPLGIFRRSPCTSRRLQELDDLLELSPRFVDTRDVAEARS
jgi:hypothetical protein